MAQFKDCQWVVFTEVRRSLSLQYRLELARNYRVIQKHVLFVYGIYYCKLVNLYQQTKSLTSWSRNYFFNFSTPCI